MSQNGLTANVRFWRIAAVQRCYSAIPKAAVLNGLAVWKAAVRFCPFSCRATVDSSNSRRFADSFADEEWSRAWQRLGPGKTKDRPAMAMRTRSLAASLILGAGLAACGERDASTASRTENAVAEARPADDPARVIEGVVTAPEGVDLMGARAIACLTPRETCLQDAQADVTVKDGVGRYRIVVPVTGDYHVMIWKDVDGDEAAEPGDVQAFANNMEPVASGQILSPMTAFLRQDGEMSTNLGGAPMGAAAEFAASGRAVRALNLAGRWTQSSSGSELVWGPEIKIQPAISTSGFGTDLGGTFGPGSQTNTTIVYSFKPMQVSRRMTLTVQPDGRFHWIAEQERRQGSCRAVRQEKFGRIVQDGQRVTFVVADARQSCGGRRSESMDAKPETFNLSREDGAVRLTADKGVDWTFRPAA